MTTATLWLLLTVPGQAPAGYEVRTLGGEPVAGRLLAVTDGSVAVRDKRSAAGEWYSIRRAGTALPARPRAPHVELTNGDRVTGAVIDATGDALRWRMTIPGERDHELRFPLSALRAVWLTHRPTDVPDPDWLTAPRKRDLFQSRNGDSAAGALTAIEPGRNAVRLQSDGRDYQLPFAKLAAVGFNTDLARVRKPKGPYYRFTLADGSRLSAQTAAFDGRLWEVITLLKDPLRVPADQVVSVDVEQGKAVWLSDHKPAKYHYQTTDGEQYPWVPDRTVVGGPLTLRTEAGVSTFDRGVGLHAECTVTYTLGGKYRRFEALAGLDAATGIRGDARLLVRVDGREQPLPDGGRLSNRSHPIAVHVDLTDARELTIVTRRETGGIIQDHVNLTDARLIP